MCGIAGWVNLKEDLSTQAKIVEKMSSTLARRGPEARRREMFFLNFYWFMSTLLDRKDRMSMANGLEARAPFCDHRIVQYLWNIPWEMKALDGRGKGLLRKAMTGALPDDVL